MKTYKDWLCRMLPSEEETHILLPTSTPTYTNTMVTMVTMGDDLQPGCLADHLLTGLGQPLIDP